jgi:hypothetical protein
MLQLDLATVAAALAAILAVAGWLDSRRKLSVAQGKSEEKLSAACVQIVALQTSQREYAAALTERGTDLVRVEEQLKAVRQIMESMEGKMDRLGEKIDGHLVSDRRVQ